MSDPIGRNAMTIPERLTKMEKHIREFSIVVTGPAQVEGGFGPLPPSTDDSQRIANLQRSIDQFTLVGNEVDVQGSFHDGFSIG